MFPEAASVSFEREAVLRARHREEPTPLHYACKANARKGRERNINS